MPDFQFFPEVLLLVLVLYLWLIDSVNPPNGSSKKIIFFLFFTLFILVKKLIESINLYYRGANPLCRPFPSQGGQGFRVLGFHSPQLFFIQFVQLFFPLLPGFLTMNDDFFLLSSNENGIIYFIFSS